MHIGMETDLPETSSIKSSMSCLAVNHELRVTDSAVGCI